MMSIIKHTWHIMLSSVFVNRVLSGPIVNIVNGTLEGYHLAEPAQDVFLGIPYAQPPVGSLRFREPRFLNETWEGTKCAVDYSPVVS